jgi:ubiquinone/menaquinone biosynthesis C-methylase UbiE
MQSISFDRAVSYYDRTRRLPPEIGEQIAASAASVLPVGARVLEIGIGTGRISIPLMHCGLRVNGADLSILMMKRLVEKLPSGPQQPGLLQADASRLPLRAATFDAVFAVHVFHLIAGWQQAVSEVRRVIHPGGALFMGNSHRDPQSPQAEIREQWMRLIRDSAGKDPRPGVLDSDKLEAYLRALGAQINTWDAAQWEAISSLEATIQDLEAGVHSNTWHLSAETLQVCATSLRLWAKDKYGDLEQPVNTAMRFTWKAAQWRA